MAPHLNSNTYGYTVTDKAQCGDVYKLQYNKKKIKKTSFV